jgi:protein CpxP
MKNLATILVLVFAFHLTTIAQKKRAPQRWQLTIEQQTELTVKKMTLALDLSEKQQLQIKPLLAAKILEKEAFNTKRKEAKKENKRPTSDAIYTMKIERLDNQIAMKKNMKEILSADQFEKFEEMHNKRTMKGKKIKGKKEREGNKKRATK